MVADEERIIDWTQPARSVHNQVRAWTGGVPEPAGALGEVEGARLRITKTRLLPAEPTGGAAPGTVLRRDGDVFVVACGDEALAAWCRDEPVSGSATVA
jgi:methionyl-tRNA formyltransferase